MKWIDPMLRGLVVGSHRLSEVEGS